MICPNCRKDVEGIWIQNIKGDTVFVCELCMSELESEDSYTDYVSDMKEEYGRYRDDD